MTITFEAMRKIGDSWHGVHNMDLNLANGNAAAVFLLVIPPNQVWGPSGAIEDRETLEILRVNLFQAINAEGYRKAALRPIEKDSNFTGYGIDDKYIVEKLERLRDIVHSCIQWGYMFAWR